MKVRGFAHTLNASAVAALLSACGGSQPPISAPGAVPQTSALAARVNRTHYKVLYSFAAGHNDGGLPEATLIDVGGTLYGTTLRGGTDGEGTVFSITLNGMEKVLYSFGKSPHGSAPEAGLLNIGGTLYGTTTEGGSHIACGYSSPVGCGTVFSITTGGTEKVLHSFNGADGYFAAASLIELKGKLYGTTENGGSYDSCYSGIGCGTVFSITTRGREKVLYSFGNRTNGALPVASLINVRGTLYGTTRWGGVYQSGTVFSITPGGAETVLHSFGYGADGAYPLASLINVKGVLYGTTALGPNGCNLYGACGTAFSITTSGTEKVLHVFPGNYTDGGSPEAPLIEVKGKLYGTTTLGGPYQCQGGGCGTVFSITPGGKEKVLHYFGGKFDGVYPTAGLIDVGGTLYGTTQNGGAYGDGTVFALTP